jgi:octaheme c-type cytochrome (tetrathionate reductase family)
MVKKLGKNVWMVGLALTLIIILVPIIIFFPKDEVSASDPWANVSEDLPHTDHTYIVEGPFETGQDVTRACLECHEDAASELMQTSHWNWEGEPVLLPGRDEPVTIGKKNAINNFCIGIQGNWEKCTTCHAGYGWEDAEFDFNNEENVDCLVCHENTGTYAKASFGNPAEGVDLLAAAQSVALPTRENCGSCHFNGGGGNAVKHGDLDQSMIYPSEEMDVHMGGLDFECTECHVTEDHLVSGRSISVSAEPENQIYCSDCHDQELHEDERINAHTDTVACQTCHIPAFAVEDPTKMEWDWSTAGQDIGDDTHFYLKIKGTFVYEEDVPPEYFWYNGYVDRYILGDVIDPNETTYINKMLGDINDPNAKIFPFKVHIAQQIYDPFYNTLIQPKTVGEGGYWTEFDWDLAARLGSEYVGLPYSGRYDFTETVMYWPTTHMVQPADEALQCKECHGDGTRMNWAALGYLGDPMMWGGRDDGNFIIEE